MSTVCPFLKQDSLTYVQVLRTQVWTQDSCLITQMEVKNINWPELVFSGPSLGMIFRMSLGFAELLRKKDLSLSPTQLEICSSKVNSFSNWRRKHLYGSGGADPPIWYHCADVCFWGNSSPTLAISKVWLFRSSIHAEASSLICWVSCVSINLNTQRFQCLYNAGKKHYWICVIFKTSVKKCV